MVIRICDRCGAVAQEATGGTSARTIVVPQAGPATNAVTKDCEVSMGIDITPQDLCAPCQASALFEYGIARLSPELLTTFLRYVTTRIRKAPASAQSVLPVEPSALG